VERVFLLSPARCEGRRAAILLAEKAEFALAARLRTRRGAPLGDVFSFLSGLYFRGKLAYAAAFARPPEDVAGTFVITSNGGLQSPARIVTAKDLRAFAEVPIDVREARYRAPLERDVRALAEAAGDDCEVVLLGSIATKKYVEVLGDVFRERLVFPTAFVGRGDMSRGGLMLRCVAEGSELAYEPVRGMLRRGARPPRLTPLRSSRSRLASRL
jgi:hypothetical protein